MPSRPYTVQFSGSSAELWTARRLSFDNKADQPAKNAILGALDLIVPDKDQLLSATLTCPRDGFFDVENVLLYNLGRVSTLGRLAHTGLRFEYRSPAGLSPHPAFPFHHTYTLVPLATSSPGNPVASFRCTLRRLRSDQKPGPVWYAVRTGLVEILSDEPVVDFALSLDLTVPAGAKVNLAAIAKGLFDGVICALHSHSGGPPPVNPLTDDLRPLFPAVDRQAVSALLHQPEPPLGQRADLLGPWNGRYKWNPADDRCLFGQVRIVDRGPWALSGTLSTLSGT